MSELGFRRRRTGPILAALLLAVVPSTAAAYTISNELSDGCHERITSVALRAVRKDLPTAAPLAISDDDAALVDDLQFTPDDDMKDLGGATLLVAMRDNDLKGRASDDLSALAEVHGNPDSQFEHCLRAPDHVEPGGSKAAVDACRAFIRERALAAIAGLDDKGMPDPSKRTALTVHLSIRGTVHAPLPTYYVAAGQAIHAIEDSFTHTYRTADEMKITVVLNYFAQVGGTLVESRDGPGHATELDRCDDPDDLRKTRRLLAIDAASAFLRATLDATKTNDQKMAAVDTLLDTYLSYSPGCTFDNNWCDATENRYKDAKGCGCRLGNIDDGLCAALAGGALVFVAVARRARRRKKSGRRMAMLGVAGALSIGAADARADTPPPTTTTTQPAQPATPSAPATPETTTKVQRTGLFLQAKGGTLLLDEVGELPLELQPKLLRALQERTVRPVGGNVEHAFDARILTATNRDLERDVSERRFREDLYYRLNVVQIDVPPLRQRGHDVLALAHHVLLKLAERSGTAPLTLSAPAAERLMRYAWPGNVRELENCIERAVALARYNQITVEDLPDRMRAYGVDALPIARPCNVKEPTEIATFGAVARRHVLHVLSLVDGNKTRAAEKLGIDRRTLYRMLAKYDEPAVA